MYLLDANVIIDADRDYYPIDRVPEFWNWLLDMCKQGKVKIPIENYEEITPEKEDLILWLKRNANILILEEPARQELVARVVEEGYANDLTDEEIEKIGNDPFLAAYAIADVGQRCVVTTEYSRPRRTRANRHLPDVCRGFDVRCINTFDLVRELDFRTGRGIGQ